MTARYYELRLNASGIPGPPLPLHTPRLSADDGALFAVSQDGSELAISVNPSSSFTSRGEIVVVSLATGATRTWQSPDPGSADYLSWAGNSRLAFDWMDHSRPDKAAAQRSGLRLLDTAAAGRNLLTARLLISASARFGSYTGVSNPLISPDGSTVFDTMTEHAGIDYARSIVVEFSGQTGRPLRAVTPSVGESGFGAWCGALWADPSGRHALAVCFKQGRIDDGLFTAVSLHFPGGTNSAGGFFAW